MPKLNEIGRFYKISDRFRASIPDILGCVRGNYVAIEVKIHPNNATKSQNYELNQIANKGGLSLILIYNKSKKVYTLKKIIPEAHDLTYLNKTMGEIIGWISKQFHSHISVNASTSLKTSPTTAYS